MSCCPDSSIGEFKNWTCSQMKQPTISHKRLFDEVHEGILSRLQEGVYVIDMHF